MLSQGTQEIFEVISRFGKRIRLTRPQWIHILDHHKEMENQQTSCEKLCNIQTLLLTTNPKIPTDIISFSLKLR